MGSDLGLSASQLRAVAGDLDAAPEGTFTEADLAALAYADAMTTGDVDDDLFSRVAEHFDDDEIVELTATIAWENASARFNRALRVPSQHLWGDAG